MLKERERLAQMEDYEVLLKSFNSSVAFMNKNMPTNSKNIVIRWIDTIEYSDLDGDFYYKAGKILVLFYLYNLKIAVNSISYSDGVFYIKKSLNNLYTSNISSLDSVSIAQDIINKSVFNIDIFPVNDLLKNKENYFKFETGFTDAYRFFLNSKIELIKILNNRMDNINGDVITKLKLLSENDLKRQIKILRLKYNKEINNKILIEEDNYNEALNKGIQLSENIIENSIIGVNKNIIELTWIMYENKKLVPFNFEYIEIALLFAYLNKYTDNKYLLNYSLQTINTIYRNMTNNDEIVKLSKESKEEIFERLYILNSLAYLDEINKIVKSRQLEGKEKEILDYIILNHELLYKDIYSKVISLFPRLILSEP